MSRFTFVVLAFSLIALPLRGDDKATAGERDMNALQGKWLVTGAFRDGKKLSDDERNKDDANFFLESLAIEKDTLKLKFKTNESIDWYFELDTSVTPHVVKFGEQNDKKVLAIYRVEGDKLTLAFAPKEAEDRTKLPKKLETKPGDGAYLFEFEREKKK